MSKRLDLVGQRFGRLEVLNFSKMIKGRSYFICKCDCGEIVEVQGKLIKSGNTKSCGCFKKDQQKILPVTHGMAGTRFYKIYKKIKERCDNSNFELYHRYGGRGIKCLWNKFEDFRDDMHSSYLEHVKGFGEKQTTIDRINNDGNYYKENCRWATYREQGENRSDNRMILYKGKMLSLSKIARINNLEPGFVRERLEKWGDINKSVMKPKKTSRLVLYKNKYLTIKELSIIVNIIPATLRDRIDRWGIKLATTKPIQNYVKTISPSGSCRQREQG